MSIELLTDILSSENPMARLIENEEYVLSLIPELAVCKGFQQNNSWHIYDVYEHILRVVEGAPRDFKVRCAALFHDVGKPAVYHADENGVGHFYGHWEKSVEIFEAFAREHGLDGDFIASVSRLIHYHDINLAKLSERKLKGLVETLTAEELTLLFGIKRADLLAQNPIYHGLLADYDVLEARVMAMKAAGNGK